ncbi:MAG: anti-sigma factor domain-containing protein [Acetobacteraceae bacterium]|nr:anti-sigma factor domain-containing protein [Acetobacteraceae bacterium]
MKYRTALILEARGRRGVALTPDGRFVRVFLPPGAAAGQELELTPRRSWGAVPRAWGWLRPVAGLRLQPAWAVAVALVLLLGLPLASVWVGPRPDAYLSLDINPSLELGLDRSGAVLSLRGLNPEGVPIAAGRGWRGRPVEAVVAGLVSRAAAQGYLSGPGPHSLVLGLAPAEDRNGDLPELPGLLSRAQRAASEALGQEQVQAQVEAVSAPAEVRSQAQSLGLSVGKYVVLLVARESGVELDPQSLAHTGIGRAIQEAGARPRDILGGLGQKRDILDLSRRYQREQGKEKPAGGAGSGPASRPGPGGGPGGTSGQPGGGGGAGQGGKDGRGDDSGSGQGQGQGQGRGQGQGNGPGPAGPGQNGGSGRGRDADPSGGGDKDKGKDSKGDGRDGNGKEKDVTVGPAGGSGGDGDKSEDRGGRDEGPAGGAGGDEGGAGDTESGGAGGVGGKG